MGDQPITARRVHRVGCAWAYLTSIVLVFVSIWTLRLTRAWFVLCFVIFLPLFNVDVFNYHTFFPRQCVSHMLLVSEVRDEGK